MIPAIVKQGGEVRRRPGGSIDPVRAAVTAIAVLALAAAVPSAAAAAKTRFASPLGSGSACTAGSPCLITTALSGAASGDTVMLAGNEGTYGTPGAPIATELRMETGVSMQGTAGQPMPQIYSERSGAAWAIRMEGGSGQKLSGIAIHLKGGAVAAVHANGTVERVLALSPESTAGCDAGTAVILDSVCAGLNGIYNSAGSHFELTLRNDTLVGSQKGLVLLEASGGQGHIGVFNTIVRGGTTDIEAHQFDTATIAIDLDHSNYASVKSEGGATVTAPGSGANQTAAPLFVNATSSDFRQVANSPAVDAGANEAANGLLDLEGNGRTLASRIPCPAITDIGAYEFVGGPAACPSPPAPLRVELRPVPATTIVKATIRKRSAKFRFEGSADGESLSFECKLDKRPFRACTSPKSYKKLKRGKHRFAVRAVGLSASDPTPAVRKFRIQAKT